ncbi:MAG: GAF and ANTAR domain-containing protein [Nocardioidaceae bacterium]
MSPNDDVDGDDFRPIARLAEAFGATVELLTRQQTETLSADGLVAFAHECMPRTQHTGLLLREDGKVRSVAATSDLPERLEGLRRDLDDGPVLDVLESNDCVISDDLADDPRWPRFGRRAVEELDVRSIAAYRLHLGPQHHAALVFLSDWPAAFDEVATAVGAIYAAYCSLVLVTERLLGERVSSPRSAEVHREIGVAVGILLADGAISTGEAYRRLSRASESLQRSLHDVARHVARHRELPEPG